MGEKKAQSTADAAILTATVVDSAFEDAQPKPRKLQDHLERARAELKYIPRSRPKFFQRLAEVLLSQEGMLEHLYPFLDRCKDVVPPIAVHLGYTEPRAEDLAETEYYIDEQLREGLLQFEYQRDPLVEQWIAQTVGALRVLFAETHAAGKLDGKNLARLLVGTMLQIYNMLCGVTPRYIGESERPQFSYVGRGVETIRRACFCALCQDVFLLLKNEPPLAGAFEKELLSFLQRRIRPWNICLPSSAQHIVTAFTRLKKIQEELSDAIRDAEGYAEISRLAERFRNLPPHEHAQENQRVFPYGHVTLVLSLPQAGEVFYFADGRLNVSGITVRTQSVEPRDETVLTSMYPEIHEFFGISPSFSCIITPEGDPVPTPMGRFTPHRDPSLCEDMQILRNADSHLRQVFMTVWEAYPALFGAIQDIEPLIMIVDGTETIMLCLAEKRDAVARILPPETPVRDAQPILEQRGIASEHSFAAFAIPAVPARGRERRVSAQTPQTREEWRKMLRDRLGDRVPSFDWLMDHFRDLDVESSTQGKGSHTSLHRNGRRETLGCRIRETTGSLPIGLLFSALEHLGIPYQEFITSLERKST